MQDEVLIAGFGRRGHAVGDIPGVRFKVQLVLLQFPGCALRERSLFCLLLMLFAVSCMPAYALYSFT